MIQKIAALIAAALVPKVIELIMPIIHERLANMNDAAIQAIHTAFENGQAEIHEATQNGIKFAITQLDHNKDGKVDLKDLFNR